MHLRRIPLEVRRVLRARIALLQVEVKEAKSKQVVLVALVEKAVEEALAIRLAVLGLLARVERIPAAMVQAELAMLAVVPVMVAPVRAEMARAVHLPRIAMTSSMRFSLRKIRPRPATSKCPRTNNAKNSSTDSVVPLPSITRILLKSSLTFRPFRRTSMPVALLPAPRYLVPSILKPRALREWVPPETASSVLEVSQSS
jgi:hypothetical protein